MYIKELSRGLQSRCSGYFLTPDIILFSFCFSVKMFNSSHWDTPNQQHKGPEGGGLQSQSAGSKQQLCEAGDEKHIEITLKLSFISHDPLSSFFILRHAGPPYWRVICCWRQRMAVCIVEIFQKPSICFFCIALYNILFKLLLVWIFL